MRIDSDPRDMAASDVAEQTDANPSHDMTPASRRLAPARLLELAPGTGTMNATSFLGQWLLALVLACGGAAALPPQLQAGAVTPARPQPRLVAPAPLAAQTRAGFLQDVIGNRSRLIQVSFIFIIIGIFILWKK
jgi:hypothetical protein